jgi:hypothetical protein
VEGGSMKRRTMETGWHLLKLVTPGDVDDFRNRVDATITALDGAVQSCPGMNQGSRDGWAKFIAAWRAFKNEDSSWLHALGQYETTEAYEQDIAKWQDLVAHASCALPTPRVQPGSNEGAPPRDGESVSSTIKWVAIAAVAVVGVMGLRTVMR